jgi:hypothetical protein
MGKGGIKVASAGGGSAGGSDSPSGTGASESDIAAATLHPIAGMWVVQPGGY